MTSVVLLLTAAGSVIPAAIEFNTNLQHNPLVESITQPHDEFCSSGCCTYSIPFAFIKHLKNEHCEAAWHAPVEGFLADPSHPTSLQYPAVEVTAESLVTKKHVDGLWIDIRCHYTNFSLSRFLAVFRANKTVFPMISAVTASEVPLISSGQPRTLTVSCSMLSTGGAVLVVSADLILCAIY